MKLENNIKKAYALLRSLLLSEKGYTVDAMTMARDLYTKYGIIVDWHDVSEVLEKMIADDEARYNGFGTEAQNKYLIVGVPASRQ